MRRRSFISALAGVIAAKPDPVTLAGKEYVNFTTLTGIAQGVEGPPEFGGELSTGGTKTATYIKQRLKFLAKPEALKCYQRRTFWLNGLDPNVAACRSISMVNKIRISKDIAYKDQEENQLNWFDLAIKGVFRGQDY